MPCLWKKEIIKSNGYVVNYIPMLCTLYFFFILIVEDLQKFELYLNMISLMIKMCNLLIIQCFQIAFYLQQSDFPNIDHNNFRKISGIIYQMF